MIIGSFSIFGDYVSVVKVLVISVDSYILMQVKKRIVAGNENVHYRIELRAVHWHKLRYQIYFKKSKGGLGCIAVMDRSIIQNDHQVRLASHNIALSYMSLPVTTYGVEQIYAI